MDECQLSQLFNLSNVRVGYECQEKAGNTMRRFIFIILKSAVGVGLWWGTSITISAADGKFPRSCVSYLSEREHVHMYHVIYMKRNILHTIFFLIFFFKKFITRMHSLRPYDEPPGSPEWLQRMINTSDIQQLNRNKLPS